MEEPDLAFTLFEIAKKDLGAAEVLYNTGYYPQAVFYLEQAVEKATKAWALKTGVITKGEAKNEISHNSWKIYRKLAQTIDGQSAIQEAMQKVEQFPDAPYEIKAFFIVFSRDTKLEMNELKKIAFSEDALYFWLFLIKSFGLDDEPPIHGRHIGIISEIIHANDWRSISLHGRLLTLSLFLTPHVATSRYPDSDCRYGPHTYTRNTPLIQKFPELIELVKSSFELLESFFDEEVG